MIEMREDDINGVAAIHACPAGQGERPLPTVFFFHGYTSSKEVYSYFCYALASAGFRVIAPDALMHGKRFDGDEERRWRHFWDIFRANVSELPDYAAHYRRRGLIADERIGVCGASLGGMTALAAMAQYPWLRAVAAFMGSGYVASLSRTLFPPVTDNDAALDELALQLTPYDVGHQLEKLADRPLLVWHGLADQVVPAQESERLYRALAARQLDQRLTYLTEAGIGHKITPTALQAGVEFFRQRL